LDVGKNEIREKYRKIGVLLKKEISSFIANRILWRIRDEAIHLLEKVFASHEEIDLIVTKSVGHPICPLALTDLTGLDVAYLVNYNDIMNQEMMLITFQKSLKKK
jgi:3-hydroxybutyryl-CoA dehydrogenase